MVTALDNTQLIELIDTVFKPGVNDRILTLITDIPTMQRPDNEVWRKRRGMVESWYKQLLDNRSTLGFDKVMLVLYESVESNNADLPETFYIADTIPEPADAASLSRHCRPQDRDVLLAKSSIVIAATELSATAPLKILAKRYGFRAATMPGFKEEMLPALGVDYLQVHRRVMILKERLDRAIAAELTFTADDTLYRLTLDLRYRTAHASSGLIHEPGTAGNLPSGEAYIVPYEGERENDPSRSNGLLPVRFGRELLVFRIEKNRTTGILGDGPEAEQTRILIDEEPARGNIAELGLGILDAFGIEATGSVLLDEKLGLHIAFGRSEHFGGITGPTSFHNPKNIVHQDYVYVPSLQPGITVTSAILVYPGDEREEIMKNGTYLI